MVFASIMGQGPIVVQYLVTEDGPNDFPEFDANFSPQIPKRGWQWKLVPGIVGERGSEGKAAVLRNDKKKKPKLVALVKEKTKALLFQISDPSKVGVVNHELELPYKTNIPVVIFCASPDGRDTSGLRAAIQGRLSPSLRTRRVNIIPYEGQSIPVDARDAAMDWIAEELNLEPMEDEEEYPEETLSLVVVGSAHVGKTSLLQRYVNDEYNPAQTATMGIDKFTVKRPIRFPGRRRDQNFILDIWDTAGEARYRTVTLAFYNSAHGYVLDIGFGLAAVVVRSPSCNHQRRVWPGSL